MQYRIITCILFCCFGVCLYAQPYTVENGKTRHRFAQLNVGLDGRTFLSNGSQTSIIQDDGSWESMALSNETESRIIIGGTHFWGHADFYIGIPITSFGESGFATGVETGARYFPWRIEHNKVRPYIGMALLPVLYKQGNAAALQRFEYPFTSGMVFNYKNHLIEFGAGYNYSNTYNYYITELQSIQLKTQPFWVSVGYKYMIETSLSAEKDWLSGKTQLLTDTLMKLKRLNGFTLAIGPSSAFFLKPSDHNTEVAPYVDQHKGSDVFPEMAMGYYFHKPDIHVGLAYRKIRSNISAFDFSQEASRQALTLEGFKFFADYHGFAAFAGPAMSYELLHVNETNKQVTTSGKFEGLRPGITFGWDIRPNRLQSWYLRTNLRYFPNLHVQMPSGKDVPFDQLEFNFIQLVIFPGRIF